MGASNIFMEFIPSFDQFQIVSGNFKLKSAATETLSKEYQGCDQLTFSKSHDCN